MLPKTLPATPTPPPVPAIERVGVRVPPFWPANPEVWFGQIEAQFELTGVTVDDTRYNYVIANLDSKTVEEVSDVLRDPPEQNKYAILKEKLIKRFGASQAQKTRQLLEAEDIGDRKPSQFLRHLRSLAEPGIPDSFLRALWMARLPATTQAILATQKDVDLDVTAELADSIADTTAAGNPNNICSVNSQVERLEAEMRALRADIAALAPGRRDDSRAAFHRRSPTPARGRPASPRATSPGPAYSTCWYHRVFGRNARRCRRPCDFRQGNAEGGR